MIAELICNDCHEITSLLGYNTRDDLKYTKFANLLETELKTEDDFEKWLDEKLNNGSAYYIVDTSTIDREEILTIDGEEFLCELERWERSGRKCPECGSTNCYWV